MERIYRILFACFFILGVFSLLFSELFELSSDSIDVEEASIKRVIDGDTVVLEDGERVRLLGFDSEEEGEECFEPATEYLKELLECDDVELVHQGERNRDYYGRLLRYIFQDGININKKMVKGGHGVVVLGDENDEYITEMIEAEEYAWRNKAGCLWSERKFKNVCDADNYVGEWNIFEGKIKEIHSFETGFFINFGSEYPDNCFSAVIWDEEVFEKSQLREESEIKLHGEVETYREEPQIVVDRKSQLMIK